MGDGARDGPEVGCGPHGEGDPVPSPRPGPSEALARHRRRTPRSVGWQYLEQLIAEECYWIRSMIRKTAAAYNVDPDDLHQEVLLGLYDCDVIELGRPGLRAWLKQRARWKATEMLRSQRPHRLTFHDPDQLGMIAADQDGQTPARSYLGGVAHQHPWLGPDWNLQRLRSLGLGRDAAQVVLLVMWGLDVSLKDFADLAGLSHASVRKHKERGLKAIHALLGLLPEEDAVMRAVRKHGSVAAAARHLQKTAAEVAEVLARAMARIQRVLDNERDDPDVD